MIQWLTNQEVRLLNLRAGIASVSDLLACKRYNIFWGGPPHTHTDFSPLTPNDTEIMRQISKGWNWKARPVVLHIGNYDLAAAVHHFPHGSIIGGNPGLVSRSNTRPPNGWELGGHMCMYYKDSTGGTPNMRESAYEAFELTGGADMRLQELKDFPESLQPELQELIKIGALKGNDGKGGKLDLTVAEARILIISSRITKILNDDKNN